MKYIPCVLFNLLTILFILNKFKLEANANEVIGCGGFIKSNTEINYKIIKIKLLTPDGAIKYSTEASTVNGYYMIPIYNKGEYILQVSPPPGWSFEPNQFNINVDGQNDACSKNEDINFHFKGFGLSGRVVTDGDSKHFGPSGIKLNLLSSDNSVIDSTISSQDGSYYFSNVMPGSFRVEASHPTMNFLTNKVNVVLSKDNWSAKDDIVVSGFRIEGSVLVQDKSPVKDAIVELHFSDPSSININTKNFDCESKNGQIKKDNLRICNVKTDSNGKFIFSNVAFGKYKLLSSYAKENLAFEMQPDAIQVDLTKHQNVQVNDPFLVNTVSIKCQALLDKNGKPLQNGEIFINEQKTSLKLNNDGTFHLSKLKTGTYKLAIKSNHVYFEEKTLKIDLSNANSLRVDSPNYQQISKFIAKSFDVCGQVKLTITNDQAIQQDFSKSIQIKVYQIKDIKQQQDLTLIKSTNLDKNLKYCLVLDGGIEYLIKAELAENLSNIVRLVPDERKIQLTNSPLLDVNFERLEANLNGKIVLLDKRSLTSDLVVTIKSTNTRNVWTKDLQVKCQDDPQKKYICSFNLNNLFFGSYQLTTNYDDLFCFNSNNLININSENQNVIVEQTGFKINYELSHKNAMVKVNEADQNMVLFSKNILNDKDRKGEFCLPKIGKYVFNIDSCHKFTDNKQDQDFVIIDLSVFKKNSNNLKLKAIKNKLTVDVLFKLEDASKNVNSEDIIVEAHLSNSQVELVKLNIKQKSKTEIVFTGITWLPLNQLVKLVAKSNKILFETSEKQLEISENNCDLNFIQFEGKLGIFIQVNVKPKNIDSIDLTLKSNDNLLQQVQINGEKGFQLGPLKAPFSQYTVELSKNGYLFNKLDAVSNDKDVYHINFQTEKLGQLNVNVVESKSNLENVLLSLTSEDRSFRQTLRTDENGQASFVNLKPGLYYLILMMQEYEFKPNSHPVQITDGYQMNLMIEAKRVAYSCFGKVTTINGQPEDQVLVEANAIINRNNNECESSKENAKVETNGQFRIRNLKPKCGYLITLKHLNEQQNKNILKIVPENYQIKVENQDVKDLNFVFLDKYEQLDLTLDVSYRPGSPDSELPYIDFKMINNYVRIKLFKTNQPDSIIQTQYVIANSMVYFNQLPRDSNEQYSVLVELLVPSSLSSLSTGVINPQQINQLQQQPVLQRTELTFFADKAHKHLSANFKFDRKRLNNYSLDPKQQQYQNVYFTLPLFILIIGLLLNSKKVQLYLTNLRNYIQQRGGIVKFIKSLTNPTQQQAVTTSLTTSQISGKKSSRNQREASFQQSSSDNERSKSYNKQQQRMTQSVNFQFVDNDTELTASTEEDNDFSDLTVITPVKRKVKKTY